MVTRPKTSTTLCDELGLLGVAGCDACQFRLPDTDAFPSSWPPNSSISSTAPRPMPAWPFCAVAARCCSKPLCSVWRGPHRRQRFAAVIPEVTQRIRPDVPYVPTRRVAATCRSSRTPGLRTITAWVPIFARWMTLAAPRCALHRNVWPWPTSHAPELWTSCVRNRRRCAGNTRCHAILVRPGTSKMCGITTLPSVQGRSAAPALARISRAISICRALSVASPWSMCSTNGGGRIGMPRWTGLAVAGCIARCRLGRH